MTNTSRSSLVWLTIPLSASILAALNLFSFVLLGKIAPDQVLVKFDRILSAASLFYGLIVLGSDVRQQTLFSKGKSWRTNIFSIWTYRVKNVFALLAIAILIVLAGLAFPGSLRTLSLIMLAGFLLALSRAFSLMYADLSRLYKRDFQFIAIRLSGPLAIFFAILFASYSNLSLTINFLFALIIWEVLIANSIVLSLFGRRSIFLATYSALKAVKTSSSEWKKEIKSGSGFALAGLLFSAIAAGDRLVLAVVAELSDAVLYAYALRIAAVFVFANQIIRLIVGPVLLRLPEDELQNHTAILVALNFLAAYFVILVIYLFYSLEAPLKEFIVRWLGGEAEVFIIAIPVVLGSVMINVFNFTSINNIKQFKSSRYIRASLTAIAVNLPLSLVLGTLFGAIGVVISSCASILVWYQMLAISASKKIKAFILFHYATALTLCLMIADFKK